MLQPQLLSFIAGTSLAIGAIAGVVTTTAHAGQSADSSLALWGSSTGVSASISGSDTVVAMQRGNRVTIASTSPVAISGSCSAQRVRNNVYSAVCTSHFGAKLDVSLGDAGNKVAISAQDMIVTVNGSDATDDVTVRALVAVVKGNGGDDTINVNASYGVNVDGGAGNDAIKVDTSPIQGMTASPVVHGGDGNDTIVGSSKTDHLSGDAGDDTILGGDGNDFIEGGTGSDSIDGGRGADKLTGDSFSSEPTTTRDGTDVDTLYYANIKGAWSVTQDGDANDGSNVDRFYWEDAHKNYIMDEVTGFEKVVNGPMP